MKQKILIYGLVGAFLAASAFGVLAHKAAASYPNNSYMMPYGNTSYGYPYGGYNNYPYQTNYQNSYPNYSSSTVCPPAFILTTYNGVYGCYLFPSGYNSGYNNNYYNSSYYPNNYPYNTNYYDNYYDSYDDNNNNNGNGDLSNFQAEEGDDSDTEEGENDAEIMQMDFDVDDGDVQLDRVQIDFEFTGDSNVEDKPWNVFDNVRLLLDGEEIDEISTDRSGEWTHESGDTYRLTFSNLNETLSENDNPRLTLEADISDSIDGLTNRDREISFDLSVPDRGIRAENDDNDTIDIGDGSDTVEVNILDRGR